jgi:putative drug exporter of the RND superfamily
MLEGLGRWAARRHWPVIIGWAVILVLLTGWAAGHSGKPVDVFAIPGVQSQEALDLLQHDFPSAAGTSAQVVFEAPGGKLTDPANAAAINATVANLQKLPNVSSVSNPLQPQPESITFDQGTPKLVTATSLLNQAGTVGYAVTSFSTGIGSAEQATTQYEAIVAAAQPATAAGLRVSFGGAIADAGNAPQSTLSEHADQIGLAMAVIILLIALGSAASMSVPIAVAVIAVTTSTLIVQILMGHFTIGTVAPILGTMIGLGVGIDYSLFIVSRHRQNLAEGMEVEDSIANAIKTSGSAVLFAGITVCIALCGLYFVAIPYVTTLGVVASLFVLITVITALTLVPALLGAYGHNINAGRIHHHDETGDTHKTLSARWANETSRHPVVFALLSFVFLLALALPLRSIDLGFTDDGNAPVGTTQRTAYDLTVQNFGKGVNGPLIVAVDLPPMTAQDAPKVLQAFGDLTTALKATPGVATVSLPIPNNFPTTANPDAYPTAAIVQVTPSTAPNDPATTDLVGTLRDVTIPKALTGTAIAPDHVYVGGSTALLIDLTSAIKAKLLPFIGGVILMAMLLLMMVFRSLFVPVKAAVMNLLSIGAALGIIVLIFNWGWGNAAIGLTGVVPIVAFVPVMMFAVLFGLSMDYEVFLLSRIKEIHDKTGDNRQSVITGLATTARVITAAALIMISVFLSFVTNPDPTVKMIGLGMAAAVFIDATVVRMVLVPSSMELAGKANWWIPAWLDRILPHINID